VYAVLKSILFFPFYVLVLCVPAAGWLFSLWRERNRQNAAAKMPFADLRRRPAGESLRLELEKLDEKVDEWLVVLACVPVILAVGLTFQPAQTPATIISFFLVAAVITAIAHRKLRPIIIRRRDYLLGYQGERYVAEELNLLMADGFHVFHDVPFGNYNIDHVLVGPSGVFIVETKARRKPLVNGEHRYEVEFDGSALLYPSARDSDALDQVRRNRDSFSKWISSATADRITAYGILTIPGWYVKRSRLSDVVVLNPKEVRGFVLAHDSSPTSPTVIQRACHQLEEKCRLAL
jgi:hypothetical protein